MDKDPSNKDERDKATPKPRARAKKERGATVAAAIEGTAPSSPAAANGVERGAPVDPLRDFLAAYDEGNDVAAISSTEGAAVVEEERRFLSFDLGGEAYAASIMDVREILKIVTPTEVPRAPREVLGVLSKRGVVMPVIDLAAVLGLRAPDRTLSRDQRVLVVGDGQRVLGLRVDRVHQVVRLPARALEEVPASLGNKGAHLLLGLGRPRVEAGEQARLLILLDIDAVLAHVAEAMGVVLREIA
ncbi:MAG: purine-binding chemotaxis protein CheW [Deltaproteobacteria bacterium]|nr:purine-binding chemotaxis protein CheW [Deltaproteobacteria bacterium]